MVALFGSVGYLIVSVLPGINMDAASLTCFCRVRELSYVEQTVQGGVKGAWFENRKRERKFYTEVEVDNFATEVKLHPVTMIQGQTSFTT